MPGDAVDQHAAALRHVEPLGAHGRARVSPDGRRGGRVVEALARAVEVDDRDGRRAGDGGGEQEYESGRKAVAGRIKDRYPHDAKRDEYIPNGVVPELQKFYIDIAHASFPYPMAAMLKFAQPSRILFGTDFSPEPIESTVNELPKLGLSAQVMRAIERENAEKLFPRFKV